MKTIIYNYFVFRNDRLKSPETYREAVNEKKGKHFAPKQQFNSDLKYVFNSKLKYVSI
jgi:hypothetical protein